MDIDLAVFSNRWMFQPAESATCWDRQAPAFSAHRS